MIQMALMAAGTALKVYGQLQADQAQATVDQENASFYKDQADYAQYQGDQKVDIFKNQTAMQFGQQQGAMAKGGEAANSASGSLFLAKQALYRTQGQNQITAETNMNVRLSMLRSQQAQDQANALTDPTNQLMQVGGTVLGGMGSAI